MIINLTFGKFKTIHSRHIELFEFMHQFDLPDHVIIGNRGNATDRIRKYEPNVSVIESYDAEQIIKELFTIYGKDIKINFFTTPKYKKEINSLAHTYRQVRPILMEVTKEEPTTSRIEVLANNNSSIDFCLSMISLGWAKGFQHANDIRQDLCKN